MTPFIKVRKKKVECVYIFSNWNKSYVVWDGKCN